MTIQRLERYQTIKRQIEIFEADYGISYISGVDLTKPSVQSGRISNPTAENAIKRYELTADCQTEYNRLFEELCTLTKYIMHIRNETVKEIAMRRFMKGQTFEEIGRIMNYDRTTVSKKLKTYISHNSR